MPDLKIEERAYLLWRRAGSPAGREDEVWELAYQEIEDEEGPPQPGIDER